MSSTSSDVIAEPAAGAPVPPRALPNGLAAFLVFLSSGAVLVLETVSLRLVGPYVGVTLQVTSSVIGVALAAIAYGAWLGGWTADRVRGRLYDLGPYPALVDCDEPGAGWVEGYVRPIEPGELLLELIHGT